MCSVDDLDDDVALGRATSTRATSRCRDRRGRARPTAARTSSTRLIKSGKRVGITAMSHSVIDNLFDATYEVFAEKGELIDLRALRRDAKPKVGALDGVRYETSGNGRRE